MEASSSSTSRHVISFNADKQYLGFFFINITKHLYYYREYTLSQADNNESSGNQWDQKFFSQISITDDGRRTIQDMMIVLLRVFLRVVFSNEEFSKVVLQYRIIEGSSLHSVMPKDISLHITLNGDYRVEYVGSRDIAIAVNPSGVIGDDTCDDMDDGLEILYLLSKKS